MNRYNSHLATKRQNKAIQFLGDIKNEMKEKIRFLWEEDAGQKERDVDPLVCRRKVIPALGPENSDFPPGYFESFNGE